MKRPYLDYYDRMMLRDGIVTHAIFAYQIEQFKKSISQEMKNTMQKMMSFLKKIFKKNFPENSQFYKGQKVYICSTHERLGNSFVGVGEIIGYKGKFISYWDFTHLPVNWFVIKTPHGITNRGIGRIMDLKAHLNNDEGLIKMWKDSGFKDGDPGFVGFDKFIADHELMKTTYLNL